MNLWWCSLDGLILGKTLSMHKKKKECLYHDISFNMACICFSQQEFFSLAWSIVLMSRGGKASAQHCSILAAGGKRGLVKLIHPRNNVAYGEFRASRKALSVLRFNPNKGNFLFSESRLLLLISILFVCVWSHQLTFSLAAGSYDNKITMWDIGGVDSQYNFKVVWVFLLLYPAKNESLEYIFCTRNLWNDSLFKII